MSRGGRPPPGVDSMYSLKVDNLTYRTSPETLKKEFEKHGDVGDVYIPRDKYSKESRGFAFVRFYDRRDAEDAIDAMDGKLLDGRELRVAMARYSRPTESPRDRRPYSNYRDRRRNRSRDRRRSYSRSRSRDRRYSRSRSRSYSYDRRRRRRRSRSRSSSRSSRSSRSRSRSTVNGDR